MEKQNKQGYEESGLSVLRRAFSMSARVHSVLAATLSSMAVFFGEATTRPFGGLVSLAKARYPAHSFQDYLCRSPVALVFTAAAFGALLTAGTAIVARRAKKIADKAQTIDQLDQNLTDACMAVKEKNQKNRLRKLNPLTLGEAENMWGHAATAHIWNRSELNTELLKAQVLSAPATGLN